MGVQRSAAELCLIGEAVFKQHVPKRPQRFVTRGVRAACRTGGACRASAASGSVLGGRALHGHLTTCHAGSALRDFGSGLLSEQK